MLIAWLVSSDSSLNFIAITAISLEAFVPFTYAVSTEEPSANSTVRLVVP